MKFPLLTFILYLCGILVYIFTNLLIKGELFNLYSDNIFPYEYSLKFWKNMTSYQRYILTQTYYRFVKYFKDELNSIKNNNTNASVYMSFSERYSDFTQDGLIFTNVPYFVVSLIPNHLKDKKDIPKLLIASHFDGHNLTSGGTAYDDAIHVATMLGCIKAITSSVEKIELDAQIDFLFDGGEEIGLIGAYQYKEFLLNNSINISYDYLNLESMGRGPPYAFVIKNGVQGNYRVQNTLSKVRGTILLPSNYLLSNIGSTTDHAVFHQLGWTGGVNVFLGKGSVYHTKFDKIDEDEHLKIAGNQLLDFILKYKSNGFNGNSVGYGIAPICIVFPMLVIYILNPIIFIVSLFFIILDIKKNVKEFLWDLLKEFISIIIVLIIFIIEGILVYLINSNAHGAKPIFTILLSLSGLCLFLIFKKVFKIKLWIRFRIVSESLLTLILITTDLSIPFASLTIFSIIFYVFNNKIIKFISAIFQYLMMSLILCIIIDIFLQYAPRLGSEFLGNIFCFCLFYIYTYHISISPLDFYEIDNKKVIKNDNEIDENKKTKSSEAIYNVNLIDNEIEENNDIDMEKNIKEYLNEDKFGNKVKIFFKTKIIPNILLIICIIFPIIILIILFSVPYPYSENYTACGNFFHFFQEDEAISKMVYIPYNGYDYSKSNLEKSSFKEYKKEQNFNYMKGMNISDCLVVDVNSSKIGEYNNKCDITFPKLNFEDIINTTKYDNGTFKLSFNFEFNKTLCLDSILIEINCNNCIVKRNGEDSKDKNFTKVLLRVGKDNIQNEDLPDFIAQADFLLDKEDFDYNVYLGTNQNSKEFISFQAFGEYTVDTGTYISKTMVKYKKK